jgi:peptidoglycan/xylan/chitin deacetylase (PgdA/CDA1 family)
MARLLERALLALGVALYTLRLHGLVRWATRRIPKVVLYHGIEPTPGAATRDVGGNVPPDIFAMHLDFYRSHYAIVSITDFVRGSLPPRALAITFDDGYRSVLEHAVPALAARGLPATIYAVPSVIGNTALIWVNELNWLARHHPGESQEAFRTAFGLPPGEPLTPARMIDLARRQYAVARVTSLLQDIHARVGSDSASLARALRLYVTRAELEEGGRSGITVGNHTWSHPSLAALTGEAQHRDMDLARAALDSLPNWVPSLAYPFGDCNEQSAAQALATGHETICEVGGANRPVRPDRIARIPISPWTTPARLFAAVEVVATLKGLLKAYVASRAASRAGRQS